MKAVLAGILLSLTFGCAASSREVTLAPDTQPTANYLLDIADSAARIVLEDFNTSPNATELGGPFRLSEYDRRGEHHSLEGRDAVLVLYSLRRPVDFLGHPQHFGVWVFLDTNETSVVRGR